jgi:hypothetical protein
MVILQAVTPWMAKPIPPKQLKMPGRPRKERKREPHEKPKKGTRLSKRELLSGVRNANKLVTIKALVIGGTTTTLKPHNIVQQVH